MPTLQKPSRATPGPSKAAPTPSQAGMDFGGVQISDAQYKKLAQLVYRLCGINLGDSKKELLKARLQKRLRTIRCPSVSDYIHRLENDPDGAELIGFLDCMTTNKTDFFREPQHFEFLTEQVLSKLSAFKDGGLPLRVWSAASSSGEEPYTLAMVLLENRAAWERKGVNLLASDLSTKVLDQARRGVYAGDRVEGIPRQLLTRYFQRGRNRWQGYVRVRKELRDMVSYSRINLMEPFHFDKPFHVIFCRNVMIYFDRPTQEHLVDKFHDVLLPGGYLMVGHSESLTGIKHRLKFVRPAVYRRET